MSSLDVQIICEDKKYTDSAYSKPTFSEFCTHYQSFVRSTFTFCTAYKLTYRQKLPDMFKLSTKLHNELLFLKQIFLKHDYSENFINKCFKSFMVNIHGSKKTTLTVERKPLALVLPYLDSTSLQTRTKLKKSVKTILDCCKLQIKYCFEI